MLIVKLVESKGRLHHYILQKQRLLQRVNPRQNRTRGFLVAPYMLARFQ